MIYCGMDCRVLSGMFTENRFDATLFQGRLE